MTANRRHDAVLWAVLWLTMFLWGVSCASGTIPSIPTEDGSAYTKSDGSDNPQLDGSDTNKSDSSTGSCSLGDTRECYEGAAELAGVGSCKKGTQLCDLVADQGIRWGTCMGWQSPTAEICDGLDNDCDGDVDEGCSCAPKATQFCGTNVGECKQGTQICSSEGVWETCTGMTHETVEVCDGLDNDCDGATDEDDFTRSCYSGAVGTLGVGSCRAGTQICVGGKMGACEGEIKPVTETCDGFDNDCDGVVDEGCLCSSGSIQGCGLSVGACKPGTQTCASNGVWQACQGAVNPVAEVCDNLDNDCDNSVDEALTQSCYSGPSGTSGVGLCKAGTRICGSGTWGSCGGEVTPQSDVCDGLDNDCDGTVDESLTRTCYSGPSGTSGVGVCKQGTQTCGSGSWGSCVGEVVPATESCDGLDNDCDGTVDESCDCISGATEACGSDVGECSKGTRTCSTAGKWGACSGEVTPKTEVCDNLDNDCDNSIDEGLTQSCYSGPSGTSGVGVCKQGTQTCSAGTWGSCAGEVKPTTEGCDNLDNDCDGLIDENVTRSCYSGPSATQNIGICKGGNQQCNSGVWGSCVGEVVPTTEVCDTSDNDCDGSVDETGCTTLYDDFTGSSINGSVWNQTSDGVSGISVSGGRMTMTVYAMANAYADLSSIQTFAVPSTFEARVRLSAGQWYDHKGLGFANGTVGADCYQGETEAAMWRGQDDDEYIESKKNSNPNCTQIQDSYPSTWNTIKIVRTSSDVKYYKDGTLVGTISGASNVSTAQMPIRFSAYTYTAGGPSSSLTIEVDWVRVTVP